MVSEGCDIRYHALALCTAGIESTTISQAWVEVVPECATYIPPNRLPTPCSTAHNKHHLHLDTVAKAPPLCYHIHTSGASGTDAGTSWVDWAAGEGEAVDVPQCYATVCEARERRSWSTPSTASEMVSVSVPLLQLCVYMVRS